MKKNLHLLTGRLSRLGSHVTGRMWNCPCLQINPDVLGTFTIKLKLECSTASIGLSRE